MTTTRINSGIYEVICDGRKFEVEKFEKLWDLFEVPAVGYRIWINDFRSKRDAVKWISDIRTAEE